MHSIAIEDGLKIAVLIPCQNQAATIGAVVRGFAVSLPAAQLFVFDNNSTDDTARLAAREGARVYRESRQGKGAVIRRMFADIDADIYVLADGDGSYDPADAPSLVNALITERVDMVVGTRRHVTNGTGGRPAAMGGRTMDWLYRRFFGNTFTDIVSGYRAFTRRFVKSFPAIATGFDIETELSMHASQLMIPVAEIDLNDGRADSPLDKSAGGPSELVRAMRLSALFLREARPFAYYATLAAICWILGLLMAGPQLTLSIAGGTAVAHLSPAFVGLTLMVAGFILAACGLVLDSLGRSRIEQKRILFLTVPALGAQ